VKTPALTRTPFTILRKQKAESAPVASPAGGAFCFGVETMNGKQFRELKKLVRADIKDSERNHVASVRASFREALEHLSVSESEADIRIAVMMSCQFDDDDECMRAIAEADYVLTAAKGRMVTT
jgi:hypothetical protein